MAPRHPQARLRAQHARHRPQRPGRPPGRRAGDGEQGPRLRQPPVLQRLQRHRRARPDEPEGGRLLSLPRQHLEPALPDLRRPAARRARQEHVGAARARRREELLQGQDRLPRPVRGQGRAQLVRRHGGLRHLEAGRAAADRLPADRRRRHPPHLVRRRPLGLRLGADRGLLRLHLHHHRHGRPGQPARGRPLLAARA